MTAIRAVVRRACRRAGIGDTSTHRLRHVVATRHVGDRLGTTRNRPGAATSGHRDHCPIREGPLRCLEHGRSSTTPASTARPAHPPAGRRWRRVERFALLVEVEAQGVGRLERGQAGTVVVVVLDDVQLEATIPVIAAVAGRPPTEMAIVAPSQPGTELVAGRERSTRASAGRRVRRRPPLRQTCRQARRNRRMGGTGPWCASTSGRQRPGSGAVVCVERRSA